MRSVLIICTVAAHLVDGPGFERTADRSGLHNGQNRLEIQSGPNYERK